MPKYLVHIWTVYGLSVEAVAATPQGAIDAALRETNFERPQDLDLSWTEEHAAYAVDALDPDGDCRGVFYALDATHLEADADELAGGVPKFDPHTTTMP